ncbi:MAG: hypothetical protein Q9191_004838 [Dirinaria sp. TL-2023a]
MRSASTNPCRQVLAYQTINNLCKPERCRSFHDYFVTHLPSSSLHPDSRSAAGPSHQLPRAASKPHTSNKGPSPAPLIGVSRDTTVVRIPLRSAKHHFGVSLSRGTRPYNEDAYQSGVIELPAFAKKAPITLTRAPANSPLQAYRESQRKKEEQTKDTAGDGEGTSAEGASGDPQIFYFGVFDGHGGTECSGFLREHLHEYIEDAAVQYGLESTLTGNKDKRAKRESRTDSRGTGTPAIEENTSHGHQSASDLQKSLVKSWRETVGGYFRRFSPPAFTALSSSNEASEPTISTVLTHAFLNADLHFLNTQLRLLKDDSDSIAADLPINTSDINPHSSSLPALPTKPRSAKPFQGGSTCSTALISTPTPTPFWHPSTPSTLITAHCGDTRILLSRVADGSSVALTTNHHPSTPSEATRLRRFAGSFVTDSFGEERLSGLANTRSFGDMPSKRIGVSAEPEIRRVELGPSEYAFMVLVSDGVSGAVADQEIVDIVKEARTPEQGARDVVAFATEVAEEGDNAVCIVVRLGGWERRVEGGGGSLGTREAREWRRSEGASPRRRSR